jgi:hypothetical protein
MEVVGRVLRLVVLLCFLLLHRPEGELASLQCDAPEGTQAPLLQFCSGEILSSTSFVADPEMRTFEGVELITFTGADYPPLICGFALFVIRLLG